MLADKVKAGKLPAVDQRLPEKPYVVEGPDGAGKYSATLKYLDGQTRLTIPHRITDHGLFGFNIPTSAFHADAAESWAWNAANTELTIKLRKGLRWSDGQPLTTADFKWYWDNVLFNKDINPNGPGGNFRRKEGDAKLDIIDDYTLKYTWPSPFPVIMDQWARSSFSAPGSFWGPAHWLKQFHAGFADKAALNAAAEKAGFATDKNSEAWVKLFGSKTGQVYDGIRWDPTMPTIRPWNPIEITQDHIVMERNPYFYMVDQAGNQLPYFDTLRVDAVGDLELYNLKITAGESDVAMWFPTFDKMELYKANEAKGNYKTLTAMWLDQCLYGVDFNWTTLDETKRQLMQNLEFRQALSLATDRDKMNKTLFYGLAEPHPASPGKTMPWYDPAFLTKVQSTYDVAEANKLLDKIGLDKKDADGYRLMKNGKRASFVMLFATGVPATPCEMLTSDYKKVGIEIACKSMDPTQVGNTIVDGTMEMNMVNQGRGTLFGRGTPDRWAFRPEDRVRHTWGAGYVQWFATGGKEGMEPPQEIKDLAAKWAEFEKLPSDSPQAATAGKAYFKWFADNIPFFCASGTTPTPYLVRNDIGNFPTKGLYFGSDNNFFHPYYPELWFRK